MKRLSILLLILLCAFLQSATTIPLTLIALLLVYIFDRKPWVVGLAFVAGFILDSLLLGKMGMQSLFFVVFLFVVMLYERKFEIKTMQFVFVFSFLGSLIYLFLTLGKLGLLEAVVAAVLGSLIYRLFISTTNS